MLQLRRITDQVVKTGTDAAEKVGQTAEKVGQNLTEVSRRGNEAARSVYSYAMNHPKSTAAVVLGTAAAAGLLWFIQRNGGYNTLRKQVLGRVRGARASLR
jgi:mannose/cellobiose epimerase-like protein (N-acyl-D-glucosamine 2-epimerase family)